MNKLKFQKLFLSALVLIGGQSMFAQGLTSSNSSEFQPHGVVIARGFLDYGAGIGNNGATNHNSKSGFEVTRAFLGYNYDFAKTWSAQLILDGAGGKDANGNLQPVIRTAFVSYHDKGLNICFGQVGLFQFATQESYWGYRYVYKSYQDKNGYSQPVDLGISGAYKFNNLVSADVTITNGEGYKKVNTDNKYLYALGLSVTPIKGLIFRASGTLHEATASAIAADKNAKSQTVLSGFIGYRNNLYSVGAEYNHMSNVLYTKGTTSHGISLFGSAKFSKGWSAYARYDNSAVGSQNSAGQTVIAGVEYSPVKQIRFSPNVQNFNPIGGKAQATIFMNVEFNIR